jgi:hypothetical protein
VSRELTTKLIAGSFKAHSLRHSFEDICAINFDFAYVCLVITEARCFGMTLTAIDCEVRIQPFYIDWSMVGKTLPELSWGRQREKCKRCVDLHRK